MYELDALVEMYYNSVGRNCNLILGAAPGPDGLLPEADFRRCAELGREISRRFGKPLASALRTPVVIRKLRDGTVIGIDNFFRLHGHLMNRAVGEIDSPEGMAPDFRWAMREAVKTIQSPEARRRLRESGA